MKADLERANEALIGGRPEEASVYGWNGLADLGPEDAPELARIARELYDSQLLREIERRGFSTIPAEKPEPEPVKRRPILRLVRALPVGRLLEPFVAYQLNRIGPRTLAAFKYLVEYREPPRVKHAKLPRVATAC